jgi:glyoxylase-like metal-dependent hydrolase (beta-lactamase superfamily II)
VERLRPALAAYGLGRVLFRRALQGGTVLAHGMEDRCCPVARRGGRGLLAADRQPHRAHRRTPDRHRRAASRSRCDARAAPDAIDLEIVAQGTSPATLLVAGGGFGKAGIAAAAFRVRGPGGTVLIDSGLTREQAGKLDMTDYDAAAQQRVEAAMDTADRIVFTHEHYDRRLCSFARHGQQRGEAVLPRTQYPADGGAWPRGQERKALPPPVERQGATALAPGVAVMPMPGHTPGSQLIYVALASGREYLFPGDVTSMERNLSETRGRSRLVADWLAPENRRAVIGWIKGLRTLQARTPGLTIAFQHDRDWLLRQRNDGAFHIGFGDPARVQARKPAGQAQTTSVQAAPFADGPAFSSLTQGAAG